jgi:hypothetical protein
MRRRIAVVALAAIVTALIVWQQSRERMVSACLSSGGIWSGSACSTDTGGPILRRDLRRS